MARALNLFKGTRHIPLNIKGSRMLLENALTILEKRPDLKSP
jgi:hypothetical protein